MNVMVFSNNASSLLASGIIATDTSVTVTAGQGALFPAITAGQYAVGTLEDTLGNLEIVWITARSGDVMTITRAMEGTSATAFPSGSRFELRVTAGVIGTMLQKTGGDILSGTTTNNGVLQQNSSGSIQGGELAGAYVRGSPGETDNQFYVPPGGGAPTIGGSPVLTKANLLNQLPSGVGVNVTGMVCIWSGTSLTIPTGYVLCDGTAGTPDLRDKFIVGAGGALPTTGGSMSGVSGAAGAHSHGGATGAHVLTIPELPSHTHGMSTMQHNGSSAGSGRDTYVVSAGVPAPAFNTDAAGSGTGHTHTITAELDHVHSVALPPYRALFYIMKT